MIALIGVLTDCCPRRVNGNSSGAVVGWLGRTGVLWLDVTNRRLAVAACEEQRQDSKAHKRNSPATNGCCQW